MSERDKTPNGATGQRQVETPEALDVQAHFELTTLWRTGAP